MAVEVNGQPARPVTEQPVAERSGAVQAVVEQPVAEQSTAELVQHAGEQISRLVRDELALARAELIAKGRHAGAGAGLLGGGGVVVLYALGVWILAAVFGLAEVMPAWLSALLVGLALLVVAGGLALLGRWQLRRAMPPVPQEATRAVRADLTAVTTALRERDRS